MSYQINWMPEAEKTFNQNVEYLSENWSNIVLNNFLDRVDDVLQKISSNPFLYSQYRVDDNIRRCVISPQIVLYYRILEPSSIDLLTFWNTYQNPDKLKL